MIKRIAAFAIAFILSALLLCGCSYQKALDLGDPSTPATSFSVLDKYDGFQILVDMDTGVMYAQSTHAYNYGTLTLLVNYDGSPRLYPGFDAKEDGP